ncbi:MAG: hypothetical protein H6738_25880, partial [Alphaproteobacteria bacterium]|nr:hypothetical protein [Alphaproteobacteria bacterium]
MSPDNPFAPPTAATNASAGAGAFHVDGELLVIDVSGPPLPDRCVKCNAPSTVRHTRQVQWNPRWVPLTIIVCWPVYIGTMLATRKTAKIDVGLCAEHEQQRRTYQLIGGGLLVAGLVAMVGGMTVEELVVAMVGFVLLIGGAIAIRP